MKDLVRGTVPKVHVTYHHSLCQHCEEAPCIEACSANAIYLRSDGIIIIAESAGRKAGLLVDEINSYQQIVVKALPDHIEAPRAISGCSILGDGKVSLIIDTGSLLKEELD